MVYPTQAVEAHTFVLCDKSMQKRTCLEGPKEENNHRQSFYLFLFSLPFLLTFAVYSSLFLSVIFSFLLSAVWIVSTARLYLKQLSSLFTATFSLFTRLSTVHVLSTASIHFLLAPGAAIRCFFWFLRGEFTTDEKFYFIHNWVALLTITFNFCRRLDAAP